MAHYKVLNLIDFLWKIEDLYNYDERINLLFAHIISTQETLGKSQERIQEKLRRHIIDGCRRYLIHKNIYNKSEGTR